MNHSGNLVARIAGGIGLGAFALLSVPRPPHSENLHRTQSVPAPPVIRTDRDGGRSQPSPDSAETERIRPGDPKLTAAQRMLRHKVELLQRGRAFLLTVPTYTAKLSKQEVVKGELLPEQVMSLKCRHSPFSVYLLWQTGDVGREVIYVEGANSGKLIAHDGGWKSRLPALSLTPDSWIAMRDARYPVTAAGVVALIDIMDGIHADDLARATVASCEQTAGHFNGRPCDTFTMRYKNREVSPTYRKSITMIDREWHVPLSTRHFEWPGPESTIPENELDDATLIESYTFTDLTLHAPLTDRDFDSTNAEYQFR